ncbi:RraA family protein [Starkeya sp. ORNL1]|uniref:RraA family protein n=1 Tax=Starkeya sp. ORNL1 TaxID=2709380 RepID=UPI0014642DCE|nr:RraA family protein [Starkeya sp. ORNL1]QJP15643.1 RraA family protein [Starkeya sp. ORNL1]
MSQAAVKDASKSWPAGYACNPRGAGPTREQIEAFKKIPAAWASDCLGRSTGAIGLNRYHPSLSLIACGPAFTVRVRPGDNLMVHKALELIQPGDMLVIDGGGDITQSLIGGNMRITALRQKIAGFVMDAAIRDIADWDDEMPCWAKGINHRGPSKDGPGEINIPIACAGMVVNPGDLILADGDGVLAIPPAEIPALLVRIREQEAKEAKLKVINADGTADPERFNSILRARGCPV